MKPREWNNRMQVKWEMGKDEEGALSAGGEGRTLQEEREGGRNNTKDVS